jgi:LysM repeat protein
VKEIPNPEHKRVFHHIVEKGDSWESIAKKHALSVEALKLWNNEDLKIGKKVSLQKPRPQQFVQHTVKSGESFRSIAKKYRCSVADLRKWNGLEDDAKIKKGDQLWIQ